MVRHAAVAVLVTLILACCATSAIAQAPVTGSPDPESLFTSPDPKLNANKQVVLHIMRDLLEAGHWNDAPKYLTKESSSSRVKSRRYCPANLLSRSA